MAVLRGLASPEEHVAPALDLAEVGPGMRVCDLGCGDGRLLLTSAIAGHPAGPVRLEVTGGLADVLEVRVWTRELERRGEVAVDLRLAAPPGGGIHAARLELAGVGVLAVVLAAAERQPSWTLIDAEDWAQLAPRIAAGGAGVDLPAVIAGRS